MKKNYIERFKFLVVFVIIATCLIPEMFKYMFVVHNIILLFYNVCDVYLLFHFICILTLFLLGLYV